MYASSASSPGQLPGVDIPYEAPEHAEVLAEGGADATAVEHILKLVMS